MSVEGGEGTAPGSPSSVKRKWCDPADQGCYTRQQVEQVAQALRSEFRCRGDLDKCRTEHLVKSETWSTGTVILVVGAALLAGVLVGGGTVLLVK